MHVLLVEDEPGIARFISQGLKESGYAVDVVGDGLTGFNYATTVEYDIIIVDILLPGMDGLQLLGKIRNQKILTPVLILTARDTIEDRVRGLDLGADDYLVKPFAFSELLARLRALQRRPPLKLDTLLQVGDLTMDVATREVKHRLSIPQEKLDLTHKSRSSIFPWRGQFSPELVEVLLDKYSQANSVVFDPFVGSGTTIFEAANLGLTCYGAEINPAAIIMAKTADFINLNLTERQQIIQQSLCLADKYLTPFLPRDLFNYQQQELSSESHQNIELFLQELFKVSSENLYIQNIIANGIIRFLSYRKPKEITDFRRALFEHGKIITKLPYSQKKCQVLHTDARKIPLPDFSVDLVITSPPYINVFNYHQNHRPAMELMGWELLKVAKSEIGSNRKHRQNRFLTVIQYALDMLAVLQEMRRLLRSNGKVIIVIGRKSTIRKIGIENTKLMATIALEGAGFELESLQERKFKNKFGEIIYEDILHLIPSSKTLLPGDEFACLVAQSLLLEVSKNAQGEVLNEILKARENANNVQKSPLFKNGRVLI